MANIFKKNKVAVSLTDVENNFEKSDRTTLFRTLKTFAKSEIFIKLTMAQE